MKINKVKLKNIGSYSEEAIYDFSSKNNISLIMAENGSGKTTLLNSIVCCLFGPEMFGSSMITNEYRDFLFNLKSRNNDSNIFQITIEFEYYNNNYILLRKYEIENDKIIESFEARKDKKIQKNFDINTMVSKELIELFFIDGEKILKIIEENKVEDFFIKFINIAFELDVFDVLKSDINKKSIKEFKAVSTVKYDVFLKKLMNSNKRIKILNEIIKKETANIVLNENNIKQLELKIEEKGLLEENKVKKLNSEMKSLIKEVNLKKEELDIILKENINYLLHQKLLNNVVKKLDETREERIIEMNYAYSNLYDDIKLGIPLEVEKKLLVKKRDITKYDFAKDLKVVQELKALKRKINLIREKLSKSNKGNEYISLLDNLDILRKEIKENSEVIRKKEIELNKLEKEKKEIILAIEKEEEEILRNKLERNSLIEHKKLEKIISEYHTLKEKEVFEKIKKEFVRLANSSHSLLRKNNLINGVEISKEEIIVLFDEKKMNIKTFSSGEKQLIIVMLLLAIIVASKVRLPLILDTFFSRLDAKHTNNLLKYFKDIYENQILILATNKEITYKEYCEIKDDIGSVFTLENDGYNTIIKKGYYEN